MIRILPLTCVYGIILVMVLLFQTCTIRYTMSGAEIPTEAQTVSVSYFQNYSANVQPTLSQDLTEALKEKFLSQTRLKLVNGIGDLHFEGEIKGYEIRAQDIKGDETTSTNRLTVTVQVRYTCLYKPDNDFEESFSRYEDYDANAMFEEEADRLNEAIIEKLVDDIFNKSVVNW